MTEDEVVLETVESVQAGIGDDDQSNDAQQASSASKKDKTDAAPSVAASSKRKGECKELQGIKKQSKTHSQRCRGCGLWFRPEGMGSKSTFCLRDKHRLDSLSRVARAQGKSKWLSDIRRDEDKIRKVLAKYEEMTGGSGLLKKQARVG